MVLIGASIAACRCDITSEVEKIKNCVDFIHVDISDGNFVDAELLDIETCNELHRRFPSLVKDYHLMVQNPRAWLKRVCGAGGSSFIFHIEAANDRRYQQILIEEIKRESLKVGVALNPETPVTEIAHLLEDVDIVQLMCVKPGMSGQKMKKEALNKIAFIRRKKPGLVIQVDGGIDADAIKNCAQVDRCIAGSYIFHAESPRQAVEALRKAVADEATPLSLP